MNLIYRKLCIPTAKHLESGREIQQFVICKKRGANFFSLYPLFCVIFTTFAKLRECIWFIIILTYWLYHRKIVVDLKSAKFSTSYRVNNKLYLSIFKKICTMDLHSQSGKNVYYEILLSEFLIKVGKNIQIILNGGVLQLLL